MPKKFSSAFFGGGPISFLGYSSRDEAYSAEILKAMSAKGLTVYPVNPRQGASFQSKVYASLSELPAKSEDAILLLSNEKADAALDELAAKGYKRVLLRHKGTAVAKAEKLGLEVAVGCPLMAYGKGLHRFHGFLAGVR
jgi:predicted CoA-binding protein